MKWYLFFFVISLLIIWSMLTGCCNKFESRTTNYILNRNKPDFTQYNQDFPRSISDKKGKLIYVWF